MTFYPHYCRECYNIYYSKVKDVIKPCPRCGEKDNINASFGEKK